MPLLGYRSAGASSAETEAHGDRAVHAVHHGVGQLAHTLAQARFVDRADLLEQDNAVARQAAARAGKLDVRGQTRLAGLRGDGGGDRLCRSAR